jgi:hypothetical protein
MQKPPRLKITRTAKPRTKLQKKKKLAALKTQGCPNPHASATGKLKGDAVIFRHKSNTVAFFSQLVFLIMALLYPAKIHAQNTTQQAPAVVELFTSKYCPACPPADQNLNTLLQQNPNVIGISCHVTYFDRHNVKDLYSQVFCDARQNIYKMALRTGGIYTPMAIVNGEKIADARNRKQLAQSAQNSGKQYQPVGLRINGAYLDIQLPSIEMNKEADVWLVTLEKSAKAANKPTSYHRYHVGTARLPIWPTQSKRMRTPATLFWYRLIKAASSLAAKRRKPFIQSRKLRAR